METAGYQDALSEFRAAHEHFHSNEARIKQLTTSLKGYTKEIESCKADRFKLLAAIRDTNAVIDKLLAPDG